MPSAQFTSFEPIAIEQSIPARFEAQVARDPDRLAVVSAERQFTYAELDRLATRLARAILARLGHGGEPVALLLEHGAFIVVAILAVLKAGKPYVSLDPASSDARTADMLEDSQARLVLTNAGHLVRAQGLARGRQHVLDGDAVDGDAEGALAESLPRVSADAGALILYTSGSTGRPKGVLHNHRNILVEARQFTDTARIGPEDRLALTHPCAYANSVRSLYAALLNGATLFFFDIAAQGFPSLVPWLLASRITIWHTLPSTFRRVFDTVPRDTTIPSLRLLRLGGESINREDVARYRRHFSSRCILLHAMGPTETLLVRQHVVPRDWDGEGNVPVGYAVPDKEVLLLDEAGREVGPGQIGEIAVRSRYLALGYWRRPDLTRAVFLPDPGGGEARIYLTGDLGMMHPDGCLSHVGRKDAQVKIRGHRVEIAEVEVALLGLPSVAAAMVVARAADDGEHRLIAYVVLAPGAAPTVSELRRALARVLPDYMVPSTFVFVDRFPLLSNGKIDRRGLPAPGRKRPLLDTPDVRPRTPIETELARLWAEVLDVEQVGIHDPFLDLGGHSLLATRLVARVAETFRIEVPMRALLTASTVAHMAEVIVQRYVEADPAGVARLVAEMEGPPAADDPIPPGASRQPPPRASSPP